VVVADEVVGETAAVVVVVVAVVAVAVAVAVVVVEVTATAEDGTAPTSRHQLLWTPTSRAR
jgi:hypothetical protein